jgi:quinolinate synthase
MGEGVLPAERTKILSTGGMVQRAAESPAERFLVATETGILHQLRKASPAKTFDPINEDAVCRFMKTITPEKLLRSLREMVFEVTVPEDIRLRAARAVERMIELGPAAPTAGVIAAGAVAS